MGIDLNRFKGKEDDDWLDLLADDPVPPSMRAKMREKAVSDASRPVVRRVGRQEANTTQPAKETSNNTRSVSIHISVPRFSKDSFKLPERARNFYKQHQKWVLGGTGVMVVVAIMGIVFAIAGSKPDSAPAVLSDQDQKADFAYSLPGGDQEAIDGNVRYDSQKKVVNFQDSIGGVTITISQQPLPESFKEDTANRVKKLAEEFAATKAITTANPTAYLGQSAKGPQTVIFSKKDLLVFIQSPKEIDEHDWAEYITNLQ